MPRPRRPFFEDGSGPLRGPRRYSRFASDPKRLPAGRQDVDARRCAEDRRRQARCRIDDVFAIVEQQQHSFVFEPGDEAGKQVVGANFKSKHGRQPR